MLLLVTYDEYATWMMQVVVLVMTLMTLLVMRKDPGGEVSWNVLDANGTVVLSAASGAPFAGLLCLDDGVIQ